MANFFVGQRVRIVDAAVSKFLIGQEARVLALNVVGTAYGKDYVGTKTDQKNHCGLNFIAGPGQLEPIIPEGSYPSEFSFHELMNNLKEEQHEHY